jgi:hypothetical protein
MSCFRINLNNAYLLHRFKGGMGVSFHFHHPKDAQVCYRPQSEELRPKVGAFSRGQRSVDRHKECPSLWVHGSWGCFITCKIMVPFHDLWIDGGETEKKPPYPQGVIEPAKIMEGISGTRHRVDTNQSVVEFRIWKSEMNQPYGFR